MTSVMHPRRRRGQNRLMSDSPIIEIERTTIDELVTVWPAAMTLLADLQIDFFCRTDRSVSEACSEAAIEPSELIALLRSELGVEVGR